MAHVFTMTLAVLAGTYLIATYAWGVYVFTRIKRLGDKPRVGHTRRRMAELGMVFRDDTHQPTHWLDAPADEQDTDAIPIRRAA